MSNRKFAVLVFASLAGVTLFLFQNCSAASQIIVRAHQVRADDLSDVLERIIINDHQELSDTQKRINNNKKKSAKN